jgi:hypothetical protein
LCTCVHIFEVTYEKIRPSGVDELRRAETEIFWSAKTKLINDRLQLCNDGLVRALVLGLVLDSLENADGTTVISSLCQHQTERRARRIRVRTSKSHWCDERPSTQRRQRQHPGPNRLRKRCSSRDELRGRKCWGCRSMSGEIVFDKIKHVTYR